MNCLRCNKNFHSCPSCGLVGWEHEYCSENCWQSDGSPKYTCSGNKVEKIERNYSELGKFIDILLLDKDWFVETIIVNDEDNCFDLKLFYVNNSNSFILSFDYDSTAKENAVNFRPNKSLKEVWMKSFTVENLK